MKWGKFLLVVVDASPPHLATWHRNTATPPLTPRLDEIGAAADGLAEAMTLGPMANGNYNAAACEMILRALADQSKGVVIN